MSIITIRLPNNLQARVVAAAKRTGTTPHSFILAAIAQKTEEERYADFHAAAEKRYVRIVSDGKTIPWNKMRTYLETRIAGKKSRRPTA